MQAVRGRQRLQTTLVEILILTNLKWHLRTQTISTRLSIAIFSAQRMEEAVGLALHRPAQ